MSSDWLSFIFAHPDVVLQAAAEHAWLSVLGTLLGAAVAIPFALWVYKRPRVHRFSAAVAETIQTIPSLALMVVIMIWLGTGNMTLVATLLLYSLMPMLANTVEGLRSVDPGLIDVARGVGMTDRQILWRVQVPIALPIILTGFRIALVTSIGIATIGVFVGAGGLGKLIYRGMQDLDAGRIFAGAAPAAAMAIVIDAILAVITASGKTRGLRLPRLRRAVRKVERPSLEKS